jgi:hypothetical protein
VTVRLPEAQRARRHLVLDLTVRVRGVAATTRRVVLR